MNPGNVMANMLNADGEDGSSNQTQQTGIPDWMQNPVPGGSTDPRNDIGAAAWGEGAPTTTDPGVANNPATTMAGYDPNYQAQHTMGSSGQSTNNTTQPTKTEVGGSTSGSSGSSNANDYSSYNNGLGMPSWLSDIYNQAGVKALDRGTGFKDWQYWSDKQDQAARLKADLAGNGPDQPGPGDSGNTSGRGGSGGGSGQGVSLGSMNNLISMMMGPMAAAYNAFGPQGNQIPYDGSMAVPSSNINDYPVSSSIPLAGSGTSGAGFAGTPSQSFTDQLNYTDQGTGQNITSQMSSTLLRKLLGNGII